MYSINQIFKLIVTDNSENSEALKNVNLNASEVLKNMNIKKPDMEHRRFCSEQI